ncbi:hypothetical protein [Celeribacter sp.]|uniref:GP88 family protein n=1 Tax=Celeribacter sp. TaxID=1890673 RepID=UPI003A8D7E39
MKIDKEKRREYVKELHGQGAKPTIIRKSLEEMGISVSMATIYKDLDALGLERVRVQQGVGDKAAQRKEKSAEKKLAQMRDRRRFKIQPIPMGKANRIASDEACEEARTMFQDRVFVPDGEELVLKDGCNNSKIGGDVLVGRLKGAYIATLTLEERATCPTTCEFWRACYGNSMQHSRRWAPGEALENQLRQEVAMACEKNEKVLIRLHVLGDFYSFDYLKLWAELLDGHENLFVFGFTAWKRGTEIGDGIHRLRKAMRERFMVRTSATTGPWGSFVLPFAPDPDIDGGYPKMIADAVVCPEQRDAIMGSPNGMHCGSCAQCWQHNRPIAFIQH